MELASNRQSKPREFEPRVFWDFDGKYHWPTIRGVEGEILEPFTSYLDSLMLAARQAATPVKATRSMIEAATYALVALTSFLLRKRIRVHRLNDKWLSEFLTEELTSVRANSRSRGHAAQAKRTVNIKIKAIYNFIYWGQKNRRLPKDMIGWLDKRIQSSLPEADSRGNPVDLQAKRLYPLQFRRVGDGSRLNTGQHWATDEEIERLEQYFWRENTFEVAVRNVLLLRVGQYTAFRNESTNSLLVSQFTDKALGDRAGDVYAIRPPKQKLDKGYLLAMDWVLVDRIREYIRDNRPELLKLAKADEGATQGCVFVSANDGTPLTDRAFGEILSDAFKAIGAPKGAGGHSLRRYRAVVQCKITIARMRTDGLPPDRDTVVRELMDLLGHTSEDAGRAYDKVMGGFRFSSQESEFWQRSVKAELELDSLRAATARFLSRLPAEVLSKIDIPQQLQVLRTAANSPSII